MSTSEELADELHNCKFYVQRCIRYHMHRAAFFGKLNRLTSFIGVVFGSATLTALIASAPSWIAAAAAVVVTLVSAFDLVVGTGSRAWLHNDLRRRYLVIESEMLKPAIDLDRIRELQREIRMIEADEPPSLALLNEIAHNEVVRATCTKEVAKDHLSDLPWYKRATANIIDWDVGAHI